MLHVKCLAKQWVPATQNEGRISISVPWKVSRGGDIWTPRGDSGCHADLENTGLPLVERFFFTLALFYLPSVMVASLFVIFYLSHQPYLLASLEKMFFLRSEIGTAVFMFYVLLLPERRKGYVVSGALRSTTLAKTVTRKPQVKSHAKSLFLSFEPNFWFSAEKEK